MIRVSIWWPFSINSFRYFKLQSLFNGSEKLPDGLYGQLVNLNVWRCSDGVQNRCRNILRFQQRHDLLYFGRQNIGTGRTRTDAL